MRIDDIKNLSSKCTGCMACVDACPVDCISSMTGKDGFIYSCLDTNKCIKCGKCYSVCPIENKQCSQETQHLYAAYSMVEGSRNRGSSGGIFELLAIHCLENGYYICGAAFDGLKLKHRIINSRENLLPLLKSKYIQSNMEGIYNRISELLKNKKKVFFCGTPCQVSALRNCISKNMKENLLTADIICHGVPSQRMFDMYVNFLEKKYEAKILGYNFRVKDNKYQHAHGYSVEMEKNGQKIVKNGVYTQSSFYNAFKKYLVFRNSCYDCRYATLTRTSDITLADFWGIEKYDFNGNTDKGVSMVITNTNKGEKVFSEIRDMIESKELDMECGIKSNYCLTQSTKIPTERDEVIDALQTQSYEEVAKKYFSNNLKYHIYWLIPPVVRNKLRKVRRI